jgi:GT2 family glycosyltransferase
MSPFVAITDDDCFVDANWLDNMAKRLAENPEAIVSGRVEPAGDEHVVAVATSQGPVIYRRPRLTFDPMSGGNMGTSIDVIKRVGLFDEDSRLRCAEDGDWAYRALRAGVAIVYAPEVLVDHYGWRNLSERATQYKTYARSHGAFYGKHLRKGDWFIALRIVTHYLRASRRWMRGIMFRDQEQVFCGRAYVTGLLPGIISGLRRNAPS